MRRTDEVREIFDQAQDLPGRMHASAHGLSLRVGEDSKDRRVYKREWMRSARALLPRKVVQQCGRCGGVGHNSRTCEAVGMRGDPSEWLELVNDLLYRHRHTSGDGFKATWQPKSTWVEEHTVIAVRRDDDDGGHLVGLLERTVCGTRVSYAFSTYRGLMQAIAARLQERLG